MKNKPDSEAGALRQAAEKRLSERPRAIEPQAEADLRRLQHELQVHQIELEMQNDELRVAQAEIAAALERYSDHFDFAPVGYFNLTADGRIRLVNLTGAKFLGIERGRVIGERLALFLTESGRADFEGFLARAFASGAKESCEIKFGARDGPLKVGLLEATLSPDRQECRAVLVDITEHKALEEQLRHAQRMAAIGTLSAGIAHDLNNTLAPIVLSVPLIEGHLDNPRDRELLEVIQSSAARGSAVVKQMLTFSRGLLGERVAVQVRHLLAEMMTLMRETFPRDLELETDVERGLWPVMGDPTQIHQVLMNLALNARDAMPNGGSLALTARNVELAEADVRAHPPAKAGPHIAITLSDTGCGIAPENIERIFDPFFTTKVREKGTGLGLSTAFGIVHSHGGFITVESIPERGATFTVFLPAAARASVATVAPAKPERGGRGELVLVVDDEPMVCRSLNLVLTMHGYEVAIARNGAEAMEIFRQRAGAVRLVVTDLMMPVMGGVELIRLLHAQAPRLRIIAFSGVDSPMVRAELGAAGVDCFLTKPCDAPELLAAIARQLDEANR